MNRTCTRCGSVFEPKPHQIQRHDFMCSVCSRAYQQAWRERRKAAGLRSRGGNMTRAYHQAYEEQYRERPIVRQRLNARAKARRENPIERHKHVARWKLNHTIASGKLHRQPCGVCGKKAHAHHDDYSRPLDVRWLCPIHHAEHHYAKAEKGAQ